MNRRLFVLCLAVTMPLVAAAASFDAAIATNQVGLDLYRQLAVSQPDDNLVVSPYSIESALGMKSAFDEPRGSANFDRIATAAPVSSSGASATRVDAGAASRHAAGRPQIQAFSQPSV